MHYNLIHCGDQVCETEVNYAAVGHKQTKTTF